VGAGSDEVFDVAAQPDGKIVVVGTRTSALPLYLVARFDAAGALDATFAPGLSGTSARAVVVRPDGRIDVVGFCCTSARFFNGIRLGSAGAVELSLALGAFGNSSTNRATPADAALLPDGALLAVGGVVKDGNADLALFRWKADGTRDTSFGNFGALRLPIGQGSEEAAGVAVQPDGKAVVAGYVQTATGEDFLVLRLNADGTLDSTFGSGGMTITPVGPGNDRAEGVALQADGTIVVAGWSQRPGGTDFAVARYRTDGTLDPSFASGGVAVTAVGSADDRAEDVAVRSDGAIFAGGTAASGSGRDFALVRYRPDGTVDTSLGTDFAGGDDIGRALAILPDGKIVLAGNAFLAATDADVALARYVAP
jgi:uncharacterized delta-60 repeat protein